MTKAEKLAEAYANRPFAKSIAEWDINAFLAGYHSRDDEVKKLREALEFLCGDRCAHQNPCYAKDILEETKDA